MAQEGMTRGAPSSPVGQTTVVGEALELKSTPAPAARPQPYRVLVTCDLSDSSEGVLREGLAIALGHMPAELHLVTIVERSREHFVLHLDAERRHASQEAVEALMHNLIGRVAVPKGSLQERVLRKVALHIRVGEPAAEILRLSQEMVADVIVVGSCEHQGLRRRAWGSIPMTILSNAGCSVVLFRRGDFVQGSPTPKAELPRPFETEGYRLQLHHYHL